MHKPVRTWFMDGRADGIRRCVYEAVVSSELSAIAYTILRFDEWLICVFVFDFMHMLFVVSQT